MNQKDEFEPPVVPHAQKSSSSPISPDRTVPVLRPPNVFCSGDDFTLLFFRAHSYLKAVPVSQYGQYMLSLLDNSAARQLLSTGIPIEAPPTTLWAVLDDLFNIRQPTLLQLERFRERKQLSGESVDQFLGPSGISQEKFTRWKTEQGSRLIYPGLSHPGLKEERIRRSPDNIRDAIQLARSYEATSELEPQLHAVKITAAPRPRQLPPGNRDKRPGSRMNCPYSRRFGGRAQRCGHNPQSVPPVSLYLFVIRYLSSLILRILRHNSQSPVT
ncbi:hypothetical protein X801_00066 [Opisthorchis viverrini]|uniref:Uncharacterized protein n=1 Tax=Opisthorchis viverrini TaxID=6198 RepID=A0A1S8XB98_OPIVI|nr:hypothetical protein X801_00066 [Opisthorchis viverrini]